MRINLYNESHLKRPSVLSALPPKSHLKARKYWAREIFALHSKIYAVCLSSATPGPNSMFHFLYSTSQSEVEWALGIVSGHIWSGDHLLTMATPIERLNAGKTAPVSNMCAQEKAQHVKYRYFTIPSFRFCCYTAGYLCFCGWLFMHCQLSRKPAKKLKYGSFPLIEFRYHHILKSGSHDETLIGCYSMLVQSGNRQNGRVGTFPCHSQDGSMRLLASAPWQRCTTDDCRLIGLLQMEMGMAYNPIPAL